MLRDTWPIDLLEDVAKQPRYHSDAIAFLRDLLTGDHADDIVILRNGVDLLDLRWEDCIPPDLREVFDRCPDVVSFAQELRRAPGMTERYRADVQHVDSKRRQRAVLRKMKLDLGARVLEALHVVAESAVGQVEPSRPCKHQQVWWHAIALALACR